MATVPGRGEYLKMKLFLKGTARTSETVSSKSASVSVGKPTMMSPAIVASGSFVVIR